MEREGTEDLGKSLNGYEAEGYCIHGVSPDEYCPQCDEEESE